MKLEDVKKGECTPGDSGNPMDQPPPWMDHDRFQRGREFFLKHIGAFLLSMHCSLVSGLSIINLLDPLVFTGKSNTPEKAFSRYFQTFLHITLWHVDDVWQAPNGKAHKSVKLVRRMHTSIAERMNKGKTNDGKTKLLFSQYDMGLVQSGFFGAMIMYGEKSGVKCSREELEDYVFFWKGMGYLLGVEDKYNICAGGLDDAYSICKEIEQKLLLPALADPPKDFEKMSDAYVKGSDMKNTFTMTTKESLFAFISENWEGVGGFDFISTKLGFLDLLRYFHLKIMVFLIRWCPYFERVSNYFILKIYQKELHQLKL